MSLDLSEQVAPGTPSSGRGSLYAGTDGRLRYIDDSGTEIDLTAGRGIEQNIQNGNYTLVSSDFSGHIYREGTATGVATWTIPANASVAFSIGTPVSFVNDGTGNVTIAINSDTLVLAATGSTGSRTLPQYGMATAVKLTSTRWIISGAGLS